MSISNADRQANMELALKLFLEQVGEQWIQTVLINPASQEYSDIFETTWMELEKRYLISKSLLYNFVLTGCGWQTALALTGKKNDETLELIGKISGRLKSREKDQTPEYCHFHAMDARRSVNRTRSGSKRIRLARQRFRTDALLVN